MRKVPSTVAWDIVILTQNIREGGSRGEPEGEDRGMPGVRKTMSVKEGKPVFDFLTHHCEYVT